MKAFHFSLILIVINKYMNFFKNVWSICFLGVYSLGVSFGQGNTYKISYDKTEDQFKYAKKSLVNGVEEFKPLPKKPKVTNNDIIMMEVENYNSYKYRLVLEKDDFPLGERQSNYRNPILLLSEIIPGSMVGLTSLGLNLERIKARGVNLNTELLEENLESLNNNLLRKSGVSDLLNELELVLMDKNNSGTDIKNKVQALDSLLREVKSKDLFEDEINDQIEDMAGMLYPGGSNQEYVTDQIKTKILENYNALVSNFQRNIHSIQTNNFKTTLPPLKVEGEGSSLVLKLKMYEINEEDAASSLQTSNASYQIWYSDYFKTPAGELSSLDCSGCEQLKIAEGYFVGYPPEDPYSIFTNGSDYGKAMEGPQGKWKFYTSNGNLSKELDFGKARGYSASPSSQSKMDPNAPSDQNQVPEIVITAPMELKRPLRASYTLGLSGIYLHNELRDYSITALPGDSISVYGLSAGNVIPVLSTFLKFESPYSQKIYPGLALGFGTSLSENPILNFMVGPTLSLGQLKQVTLSAGFSFSSVRRLRSDLKEGLNKFVDMGRTDKYYQRNLENGFYLGILFDLN
jgi:hypothetical protein